MALSLAEYFIDEVASPHFAGREPEEVRFHDPFCGSGTTVLVAKANGYDASGSDLLPSSVLLTKAKTSLLGSESISWLEWETKVNPLTYSRVPRWTWKTWRKWYSGRTLRAIQDYALHIQDLDDEPHYPHAAIALSQTAWDVSSVDRDVIVPTHSNFARGIRKFKPGTVRRVYCDRIQRVIRGQRALQSLGFAPDCPTRTWTASALTTSAWPARLRLVLCSPPYGLGIDYFRATSIQSLSTLGESGTGSKSEMVGRVGSGYVMLDAAQGPFASEPWGRAIQEANPERFNAMMTYLIEIEAFLTIARDHLEPDGLLGMVIGDPEMSRIRVPLTRVIHDIAILVGFKDHSPPVVDRIRRRSQGPHRRSSNAPIGQETLLSFVPN
jgi:hypothetical protein